MRGKTHVLLYLFAKDRACTREKNLGLLIDVSAKDTAIELMCINMRMCGETHVLWELTATKDKAHV